ncbi:transposase [Embleya sp. NPDC059237]|uniref:transposase n=1 Tax=Embleya sp. NPDC059237 TaxID=3346784 RepID=UPI00368387F6
MRDRGAWLCFADEAGRTLRPPKARTWSRRGHPPVIPVSGKGSGRISLAGLLCCRPGRRTRLIFRIRVHRGRKGDPKGFREKDFAELLDSAHRQLGGPIVLVWDNYTHHVDAAMRELIEARAWLTVFRFPTYAPDPTRPRACGPTSSTALETWPRAPPSNSPPWPAPDWR